MTSATEPVATAIVCIGLRLGRKPIVESSELFGDFTSVIIRHKNEEYTLEITRNGRLILKK